MNQNEYSSLFKPFHSEKLHLANRVVMAPMTRGKSPNNIPNSELAHYYKRRAMGGTGLIIAECTFIDHPLANGFTDAPAFYGEKALNGWKQIVEEVHNASGKIIPQIWHAGIAHNNIDGSVPSIGPVDVFENNKQIVQGVSKLDIQNIIKAFTQAAIEAKNLGFDGVEIHGAHGYLIDQFLWDKSNTREDEYGGSIENRVRFACEIVSSIRKAVGDQFPIFFRFSQWKVTDYNAKIAYTKEELEQLLLPLVEAEVDIFDVSTRRFWESEFQNSDLTLAEYTKKITGKPVIAVGSVGIDKPFSLDMFTKPVDFQSNFTELQLVEKKLKNGDFDLIAVGRTLLADPNWTNKIKDDQMDTIIPFRKENLNTLS